MIFAESENEISVLFNRDTGLVCTSLGKDGAIIGTQLQLIELSTSYEDGDSTSDPAMKDPKSKKINLIFMHTESIDLIVECLKMLKNRMIDKTGE